MMFTGSSGKTSLTADRCAPQMDMSHQYPAFTSKTELKRAITDCLRSSPDGTCTHDHYGPIAHWDVSRVTDMSDIFKGQKTFDGDISRWDVSRVTTMKGMFEGAASFNCDLSKWDVRRVTTMESMFSGCSQFRGDISTWRMSRVTTTEGMFRDASEFNRDISMWDMSSVRTMKNMFRGATSFNGDLSEWDVSSVTDLHRMFMFAKFYNRDMSKWDVSRVTNMQATFLQAASFNTDISNWDTSSATTMQAMFLQASSFNTDISNWEVSRVKDMDYMFYQAESFSQTLCGPSWVHGKASNKLMFAGSPGSISRTACTVMNNRNPMGNRELVRAQTTPKPMACPKCGTFKKSGRPSCCAPGGSWYKNCGAANNNRVDYKWTDGALACENPPATTTVAAATCAVCGTIKKSRKKSCCGPGGSWFKSCGRSGSKRFSHTWYDGIQVCKTVEMSERNGGQLSNATEISTTPASVFILPKFLLGDMPANMSTTEQVFDYYNDDVASTSTQAPSTPPATSAQESSTTDSISTAMKTTAPAQSQPVTSAATTSPKLVAATSTDSIDEFYEGFVRSESVSYFTSRLCALVFSICIILFV